MIIFNGRIRKQLMQENGTYNILFEGVTKNANSVWVRFNAETMEKALSKIDVNEYTEIDMRGLGDYLND